MNKAANAQRTDVRRIPDSRLWRKNFKEGTITIPGLKDLHTHPFVYSLLHTVGLVDISKCSTITELTRALEEKKGTGLIIASGLDTDRLGHLTRREIDGISHEDHIMLFDPSYHGGLLNTKAAKKIFMESAGKLVIGTLEDSGVWKEQYLDYCLKLAAENTGRDTLLKGLLGWLREQRREGVVEIHDKQAMGALGIEMLLEAKKRWGGEFPVTRVYCEIEGLMEVAADKNLLVKAMDEFGGIGLKMFADGSIGSQTAALISPYSGTMNKGIYYHDIEAVKLIGKSIRERVPLEVIPEVAIHAIGNRGIIHALSMANLIRNAVDRPVSIEHFELSGDEILLEAVKGAIECGAISHVLTNPNFSWDDVGAYGKWLGETMKRINPLRQIVEKGIPMKMGTDGMPQDALYMLWCAINQPFNMHDLSVEDAVGIASGVEDLADAKRTITLSGPVLDAIFMKQDYTREGVIEARG